MATKQDIEKAKELAAEMLEKLGFEYETIDVDVFSPYKNEDGAEIEMIKIDIKGEQLGNMIGRYGKTLFAFQHILTLAFNAGRSENRARLIVDINNYREKREKELTEYAERALIEVRQSNLPMALPPMKPVERRIVHLVLKKEEGIVTTSEGDEPNRYVVIKPA
jgi:spoIIIJ-associated protein